MRGLWHVLTHASRNYDVYYLELVAYSRCYKAEIKHTKVSWKVSMKEMSNQEKSNNNAILCAPRNSTVLLGHFNAFGDLKVWWGILLVFPVLVFVISFSFSWISCLVNVVFLARIKGTLFVKIKFHFHVSFVCIWVHCCLLHGAWWLEVCGSLPNQYVGILWTWRMYWNASKILGSHFSKQVKLIPEGCWTSPVLYHLFKCCSSVRATWRSSSTVVSGFCLRFLQMTWFC